MSFPTPPDDRGYSRYCTACGGEIHHCNLYGMGTCPCCGFKDRPTQDDNNERARQWHREHAVVPELPIARSLSDANASDLIDAILDGSWDIYLGDIVNAVAQRRQARAEELQARVQEVFGPDYEIVLRKDAR